LSGKVSVAVAVAETVVLVVPIAIGMVVFVVPIAIGMVVLEVVVTNPTIDYGLLTMDYGPSTMSHDP